MKDQALVGGLVYCRLLNGSLSILARVGLHSNKVIHLLKVHVNWFGQNDVIRRQTLQFVDFNDGVLLDEGSSLKVVLSDHMSDLLILHIDDLVNFSIIDSLLSRGLLGFLDTTFPVELVDYTWLKPILLDFRLHVLIHFTNLLLLGFLIVTEFNEGSLSRFCGLFLVLVKHHLSFNEQTQKFR